MAEKDFLQTTYAKYIGLLEQRRTPEQSIAAIHESLDPAFYDEITRDLPESDADPLLDAQDYEDAWQHQITVRQSGDTWVVCFGVAGGFRHAAEVKLTRRDNKLLIRGVRKAGPQLCEQQ